MRVVKSGYFFVCTLLLFVLCPNGAQASETYQRTKDGKTLVWKSSPKLGNTATWSGDRDSDGYATGNGTLTWLTVERAQLTGFNMPFSKYKVVSRYSGKMVHGKLSGMVVRVDASGTFHGKYADGRKTGKWLAGPAPTPSAPREEPVQVADQSAAPAEQPVAEKFPRAVAVSANTETEPEPPAAGPTSESKTENAPSSGPDKRSTPNAQPPAADAAKPAKQTVAKPVVVQKPGDEMDDSLKSLVGPPSLLRAKGQAAPKPSEPPKVSTSTPPTTSSPAPARNGPRLSANEVIELSNAEARKQGYDLKTFQHPQADYTAADETWSVSYDQINADGVGNRFSVSVEDKTKKTSVVPDR
jgi:hypothetical protein